jgi:ribosomal protein L20A (L18A)
MSFKLPATEKLKRRRININEIISKSCKNSQRVVNFLLNCIQAMAVYLLKSNLGSKVKIKREVH